MRAAGRTLTLEELLTEADLSDVVTSGVTSAYLPITVIGPQGNLWPVRAARRTSTGIVLEIQPTGRALRAVDMIGDDADGAA